MRVEIPESLGGGRWGFFPISPASRRPLPARTIGQIHEGTSNLQLQTIEKQILE